MSSWRSTRRHSRVHPNPPGQMSAADPSDRTTGHAHHPHLPHRACGWVKRYLAAMATPLTRAIDRRYAAATSGPVNPHRLRLEGITQSDGEGQGERARSRRSVSGQALKSGPLEAARTGCYVRWPFGSQAACATSWAIDRKPLEGVGILFSGQVPTASERGSGLVPGRPPWVADPRQRPARRL